MSFFREIPTPKESENIEKSKKSDLPIQEKFDISRENYDSTEAWVKALAVCAKHCKEIAEYYKVKADKEYAQYKNAEKNGETEAEKQKHYDRSQEYYAVVKEEKEKLDLIVCAIYNEVYSCNEKNFTVEDQIPEGFFKSKKFQELCNIFQPNNWCKMDITEKEQAIIKLINFCVKELNLPNPPQIKFITGEKFHRGSCYYIDIEHYTIEINSVNLDDPKEIIKVVAHEVWHAYQNMKAENPQTCKDYLYLINFLLYIPATSNGKTADCYKRYYNQLVEAEARAFANYVISKFGDDFK